MDALTEMIEIGSELQNLNLNIIELINVLKNDTKPSFILVKDTSGVNHCIMKSAIKEVTLDDDDCENTAIKLLDGSSITLSKNHTLSDMMRLIDGG